jgi:hypothetical protein
VRTAFAARRAFWKGALVQGFRWLGWVLGAISLLVGVTVVAVLIFLVHLGWSLAILAASVALLAVVFEGAFRQATREQEEAVRRVRQAEPATVTHRHVHEQARPRFGLIEQFDRMAQESAEEQRRQRQPPARLDALIRGAYGLDKQIRQEQDPVRRSALFKEWRASSEEEIRAISPADLIDFSAVDGDADPVGSLAVCTKVLSDARKRLGR